MSSIFRVDEDTSIISLQNDERQVRHKNRICQVTLQLFHSWKVIKYCMELYQWDNVDKSTPERESKYAAAVKTTNTDSVVLSLQSDSLTVRGPGERTTTVWVWGQFKVSFTWPGGLTETRAGWFYRGSPEGKQQQAVKSTQLNQETESGRGPAPLLWQRRRSTGSYWDTTATIVVVISDNIRSDE